MLHPSTPEHEADTCRHRQSTQDTGLSGPLPSQGLSSLDANRTTESLSVLDEFAGSASNLSCLTRQQTLYACSTSLITRPKQSIGRFDFLDHFTLRFFILLGPSLIPTYLLDWVCWASSITTRIRFAIFRLGRCIYPCTSRNSAQPTSAFVKLWPFKLLTDGCGRKAVSILPLP